jgi:hypothetical protein
MTTKMETTQSPFGRRRDHLEPRGKIRVRLHRWFTVLLLGASALLVAGHYTFGEWIFHPKVPLWRESTFWWDCCKLVSWPVAFWMFWTVASLGKIRSAPVILVATGIIGLGDLVWYSVAESLRDRGVGISPDYWDWWMSWAQAVAIGGNIILAIRWFRLFRHRSIQPAGKEIAPQRRFWLKVSFKSGVLLMGIGALFLTLVHAGLPQLEANAWTLAGARKWLVRGELKEDFDFLAVYGESDWHRYRLAALLQNVELSDLQRRQFYANLDKPTYQNYILSPEIDVLPLQELNWRRTLWEYFYPRVRHLNAPGAAAQIVVRLLRERVEIEPTSGPEVGVETIWREGVTDEKGFDRIYVAALRAVGIAARLDGKAWAEIWNGTNWEPAPRPLMISFLQMESY